MLGSWQGVNGRKKVENPCLTSGAQPALHFVEVNLHEPSFDDVIVLSQSWYNFFANDHRQSSPCNIPKNEI